MTDKLEDPTQMGKARRDIARIKTVLRQRQLAAATPAADDARLDLRPTDDP